MDLYRESSLCRLCLTTDTFHLNVFSKLGAEKQVLTKIKACLPVHILQVDPFPQTVCYKCVSTLDIVYEFWKKVTNADKTIRRSYNTSADNKMNYKQSGQVRKRGAPESTNRKVNAQSKGNVSMKKNSKFDKFINTDQSSSEASTANNPISSDFTEEIKRNRPITKQQEKKEKKATQQLTHKDKHTVDQQPKRINRKNTLHKTNRALMPIQPNQKQKDTTQKIHGGKKPVEENFTDWSSEPNVDGQSHESPPNSSAPSYESLLRQLPSFGDIVSSEAGLIALGSDKEIRPRLELHSLWQRHASASPIWPNRSDSSQETGSSSSNPKIAAPKTINRKSRRQVTNYKSKLRKCGSTSSSKPRRKLDSNIRNKKTDNETHTRKQHVFETRSLPSDSDCSFASIIRSTGMFLDNKEVTSNPPQVDMHEVSTDNESGIVKISDFWKRSYSNAAQKTSTKETDGFSATKQTGLSKDLADSQPHEDPFDNLLKSTKSAPLNKIQPTRYSMNTSTFELSSPGSDLHLTPNLNTIQHIRQKMSSKKNVKKHW